MITGSGLFITLTNEHRQRVRWNIDAILMYQDGPEGQGAALLLRDASVIAVAETADQIDRLIAAARRAK